MSKSVEIEEHFENGVVVKRLINGVEFPIEEGLDSIRVEEYESVHLKQIMSVADARRIFGDIVGSTGT